MSMRSYEVQRAVEDAAHEDWLERTPIEERYFQNGVGLMRLMQHREPLIAELKTGAPWRRSAKE